MPNRKLSPKVGAPRAARRRGRRHRSRGGGGFWMAVKVALLLERFKRSRRRESSPSFRQVALVIVTGGLAIMVIRVATRKSKSHPGVTEVAVIADAPAGSPAGAQDGARADSPDSEPADSPDSGPADSPDDDPPEASDRNETGSGTGAGTERRFTDRVQQEMSRRADAPTQAGGSGSD